MISIPDASGTNIDVQILTQPRDNWAKSSFLTQSLKGKKRIIVMDYSLESKLLRQLMSF
jgi:hypothetical protein